MAGERGWSWEWGFEFVLLCPHSLHVFQVLPSHSRLHDVEVLLQTNFRLVLLSSSSNQSSLTLSALPKHHYVPGSNFEQMKNWNIYKIEGRLRFMSALYVHRMISIGIRNLQIVMERAAHLLPSHQAFHQPWGDPRARAPDRSRICINSKSNFFGRNENKCFLTSKCRVLSPGTWRGSCWGDHWGQSQCQSLAAPLLHLHLHRPRHHHHHCHHHHHQQAQPAWEYVPSSWEERSNQTRALLVRNGRMVKGKILVEICFYIYVIAGLCLSINQSHLPGLIQKENLAKLRHLLIGLFPLGAAICCPGL